METDFSNTLCILGRDRAKCMETYGIQDMNFLWFPLYYKATTPNSVKLIFFGFHNTTKRPPEIQTECMYHMYTCIACFINLLRYLMIVIPNIYMNLYVYLYREGITDRYMYGAV